MVDIQHFGDLSIWKRNTPTTFAGFPLQISQATLKLDARKTGEFLEDSSGQPGCGDAKNRLARVI